MIDEKVYHLETTVSSDGTVIITGLPLHTGDKVEVTIRKQERVSADASLYSLRGTSVVYESPFEPVSLEDWESLQ